jgi:hypothetical protein
MKLITLLVVCVSLFSIPGAGVQNELTFEKRGQKGQGDPINGGSPGGNRGSPPASTPCDEYGNPVSVIWPA